jgi:hypothetical protein
MPRSFRLYRCGTPKGFRDRMATWIRITRNAIRSGLADEGGLLMLRIVASSIPGK